MFPTGFGQPLFLAAHAAQAQAVATVAAANAAAMQRASLMNVPLPRNTPQPPMLVPAGMAADDHLDPHADVWKEYETDDGRKYYYNKQTKQSSWSKPDENAAEKAESWREYKSDDGRVYYYNTITKKTQWDKPDVLNAAPAVANGNNQPPPAAAPALEVQHKVKSDESSEMEKAMRATLESLSTKKDTNDQDDDERSKKNRQTEIFRELLKDKYNDCMKLSKITATCSWEQAVKWLQQDPRFRVLPKVSEKKQLFNSWKVQRQKEERDEKRLAIKKAKEELEKWLQECPKMKPSLKYSRACSLFAKEPAWQAVSDSDREEIFKDTMVFVTKREAEKEEATRTRNIKALAEILESMDQITYKTTWAQAQRLLIENPQFAEDKTLQSMDKEDALIVFEEHIRNAEKEFEEEKKNEEKRFKRSERKVREKFQAFLVELHKKGELTSMSLWSSLYPLISIEPRFEAMLTQTGSTPLDLFKFYVEELKDQFCQDRRVIKEILNKMDKTATTTYEEFAAWVTSDEKGAAVDQGNMKLCFNSFMEKAESKEKEAEREETRKKRRLESEFRNLLRAHQPQIDDSAEWESVRSKIDKEKAYLALESDEVREKCFEEYKVSLNDTCGHHHSNGKKKKKDKKKKRDSDSEEDKKDKDRKKRRHDSTDDEKNRKKKSRKRSSSRSDDERKSPTPED